MKIIKEYPPNMGDIRRTFIAVDNHKPIFAYGNIIYNPHDVKITPDLEAHEQVHCDQQGDYPDVWWFRYLSDRDFRFEQELEAYGTQYAFVKKHINNSKLLDWGLDKMAEALSGELYGNLIGYGEARSKIRNFAKNLNE